MSRLNRLYERFQHGKREFDALLDLYQKLKGLSSQVLREGLSEPDRIAVLTAMLGVPGSRDWLMSIKHIEEFDGISNNEMLQLDLWMFLNLTSLFGTFGTLPQREWTSRLSRGRGTKREKVEDYLTLMIAAAENRLEYFRERYGSCQKILAKMRDRQMTQRK
jgi:hypothetical protein